MTGDDLAREVQSRCDARVAEAVAQARHDEWRYLRSILGVIHFAYRGVPDYDTCAGCNQASGGWVPWPCPTWKAIEARGEELKAAIADCGPSGGGEGRPA